MMFKRTPAIAAVTAAAIALTTAGTAPAFAAGKSQGNTPAVKTIAAETSGATEFSSRRYHRRNSNAAGIAAFSAIVGGITAYAAAREYRKAQERRYQYYNAPYGYYGGGGYYGGRGYYGGPRYYGY